MKNKQLIMIILAGIIIIGGVFAFTQLSSDDTANNSSSPQSLTEEEAIQQSTNNKDDIEKQQADNPVSTNSYITLEEYQSNPDQYASSKLVYFFHASWCPICVSIDKEITQDPSKIPAGVTIVKTDFDSSTDLRKKYGVNTQYTFVQVDSDGNEVDQWTSSNLDSAISNIN